MEQRHDVLLNQDVLRMYTLKRSLWTPLMLLLGLTACSVPTSHQDSSFDPFAHHPPVGHEVHGKKIIIRSSSVEADGAKLEIFYYRKPIQPGSPEKGMIVESGLRTTGISLMAIYRKTADDKEHEISWSSGHGSSMTGGLIRNGKRTHFLSGAVIYLFDPKRTTERSDASLKTATHTLIAESIDFPIPLYPSWESVRGHKISR